jgi:SOS response regulatory protein OraA/RecX
MRRKLYQVEFEEEGVEAVRQKLEQDKFLTDEQRECAREWLAQKDGARRDEPGNARLTGWIAAALIVVGVGAAIILAYVSIEGRPFGRDLAVGRFLKPPSHSPQE